MRKTELTNRLESLRNRGEKGLIAYITAGYPNLETTVTTALALAEAGADVVELGVPFSDPVADGPVIQAAAEQALAGGTTVRGVLRAVEEIRAHCTFPIVLMTYYNPIYRYGPRRFAADLARAGGNGVIVPDLPPEEAGVLRAATDQNTLDLIPLVAPNTPPQRLTRIADAARGFIYCISLKGVTGGRAGLNSAVGAMTAGVRRHTPLPVAVGFGISDPVRAAGIAPHCDAVVVGSALVQIMARQAGSPDLTAAVGGKARQIKDALRPATRSASPKKPPGRAVNPVNV